MLTRRALSALLVGLLACAPLAVAAQPFTPHEPLNPAKAQSLPLTPLDIVGGGNTNGFQVEVAITGQQHSVGLMHRTELGADRGMLFLFKPRAVAYFWMRNTFIPLDMLFADDKGVVSYIAENVQPHDERAVGPSWPVSAVLELPAGTVARLGIRRGDVLRHKIFGAVPRR